jgi:iron complex outermembrane receptor protein
MGRICNYRAVTAGALATLAAFAVPQLAPAQTASVSDSAAPAAELQEVVVTAQKRAESAQTTPIAITVYDAQALAQKGIVNIESLATSDTSLDFTWGSGGAEPYLTMRGVSSHDTSEVGDPAVAVATDGFFVNRPYGLLAAMYDVERVEVLRGPQGTLYGRNSTGGVVNVIDAKPTKDFQAGGSLEFGNYNALNTTGMLNMPFGDAVQMRVAYSSNKHDGYRYVETLNGNQPEHGDDEDTHSGRVEVAFYPTDHLYGLVTVQDTQIGGIGNVADIIPFVPSTTVPGDIVHSIPPLGSATNWVTPSQTWQSIDEKTYKLDLEYDNLPGAAKLIYLGGYDNLQWHHSLPLNGFLGEPFSVPQVFLQNEYPKTQNHELRVVSAPEGFFTWQAGLFFFEERSTDLNSYGVINPGSANAATTFQFAFPLVEDISKAAYGQGTIKLTDDLKVSLGVRYTEDRKERTGVQNLQVANIYGISQYGAARFSKTTGHVGLDWTATSDSFEYAKVDTGYKAGGFTTCNSYAPEQVMSYEVGTKNRALNNTVQLNASAFFNHYQDQQITTFVPSSVCISNSTVQNAGSSHIYGVEAELDALVDPVGKFDVNLTYLHARFVNFVAAPGLAAAVADCTPAGGGNCQLGGNTLSNSPTWTVAAGLEHNWLLPSSLHLNGRIEGRYQSKQYFDPFNYGSTTEGGYTLANANLDLARDNWRVGAFIQNIANHTYFNNMEEFYTNNNYVYGYGAPRTYGVRVEVTLH